MNATHTSNEVDLLEFGSESAGDNSVTPSNSPKPTIKLHNNYDVTLLIGPGEGIQPVQVSRAILCNASRVWEAMFTGPWSESDAVEIKLPDDDPDAMLIALCIAHLRFKEVSGGLGDDFNKLWNLAVVCDKYDLIGIVRPFLRLDASYTTSYAGHFDDFDYEPDFLRVAWTFGLKQSFDELARYLAYTVYYGASVDGDGLCMRDDGGRPVRPLLPLGIVESILRIREAALDKILGHVYRCVDSVKNDHICEVTDDAGVAFDRKKCRSAILKSLFPHFEELELHPFRLKGSEMNRSIKDLEWYLTQMSDWYLKPFVSTDIPEYVESTSGELRRLKVRRSLKTGRMGDEPLKHTICLYDILPMKSI